MYGNAEKSPVNWIAWSLGLFLIAIMMMVSGYMFVMYLKSQHNKNQLDEQRRIEEQKAFREKLEANSQTVSVVNTESVREKTSEKSRTSDNPESSRIEDIPKKMNGDATEMENGSTVISNVESSLNGPKQGSKEPSTEELSSKKSLTDLNPIEVDKTGETSVEITQNPQISQLPQVQKPSLSAEKAPGSSIGSEVSTYVISSQRSEMNNYNMLEAGRTPPTYSDTPLHRTSSIDTFLPNTAITSSVGTPPTVIPVGKQNSETSVSISTPPNIKK